jgi:hypothetical protein
MKALLISFCIICCGFCEQSATAQNSGPARLIPLDPEGKKIMYREVVDQQGDPGYLYIKAMEWFNYYYTNPTSLFTVQDKVNGKIEGTGRMNLFYTDEKGNRLPGGLVMYMIRLEFKENRYRYTLTDFILKAASRYPLENWLNKSDPAYNPQWDDYLLQVDTTMQRLVRTLKEKMQPVEQKKDEW